MYAIHRTDTAKGTSRIVIKRADDTIIGFCREKGTGKWTGFLAEAEYWSESAVKVGKNWGSDAEAVRAVIACHDLVGWKPVVLEPVAE